MLVRVDGRAKALAREFGCDYVGSEHLLLALFDETHSTAAQVLDNFGITAADVRQELMGMGLGIRISFAQTVEHDNSVARQ